ncbi:Hypothetical Protein FCC1311_047692 [Hondaea fermentalgiana]|uniref:Uncharacterized protein n=1 Tax=Hondaea fermentalgiana TaxID=2315210 RepID=A0A2R5GC20_9STRA|nr:Hypothetical Protein FCC1311_047692 [Hondaea fermentalgiana]|eukprot:GBG28546.1 Hypothetical Protein FCC1311_047692 [Hondaea fermentalgiana]
MLNDAVNFLADEDPHFDKDEEYSRHATWMIANRLHQYYAEHDLVEFSESVSHDTSLTDGRKRDLLYPIHQVYAYMLRTFCRFGVLSTTNITWFLKLEPDNTLRITKGYDCTGNTEATNPKYAYFRLLLKASKGSRLTLDSASLDSLGRNANLNVAGSPWKAVFDQIVAARAGADTSIATASGSGAGPGNGAGVEGGSTHHQVSAEQPSSVAADVSGSGGAAVASDGDDEARLNFLRQTLPLPQSVFPYFGGVKDLLMQNSDAYGHLIYVDTGGLQQLIAVKTPHLDPYHERDDETDYEDMRRLQAFTNEIEAYETLRPLWGSRHVPWFLYRGRHLFADVIVATTWEGHTLKSHFRKPSQYSKAVVDKARETLLMVHGLGVALRVNEPEDLASTFVLDDHGEVRLTRFRNATIKATPAELAQDIQDFNNHFLSE